MKSGTKKCLTWETVTFVPTFCIWRSQSCVFVCKVLAPNGLFFLFFFVSFLFTPKSFLYGINTLFTIFSTSQTLDHELTHYFTTLIYLETATIGADFKNMNFKLILLSLVLSADTRAPKCQLYRNY